MSSKTVDIAKLTVDDIFRAKEERRRRYVGDQAIYFLGVMNNVHLCLEKCLHKLSANSRRMIEQYYAEDKRAKIDLRKRIAAELGIGLSTLRLRALRVRDKLQTCIEQCLEMGSF